MELLKEIVERRADRTGDRRRVETVVETLAALRSQGDSLSEVAHDARNMVSALGLYCDLLEEPGVLTVPFSHYGQELRLVAAASRRLVEKLVTLDAHVAPWAAGPADSRDNRNCQPVASQPAMGNTRRDGAIRLDARPDTSLDTNADTNTDTNSEASHQRHIDRTGRWDPLPPTAIANLAAELLANRNLLAALAGPGIALTVDTNGGAQPVRLTAEDLTRVLVNLVKNAAEAMPLGGRIRISLCERPAAGEANPRIALAIEDNGPGISPEILGKIFTSGYTTRGRIESENNSWPCLHRGLGLAITRAIVEAAGGRITAENHEPRGARFEVELPVGKGSTQPSVFSS